MKLPDKVVEIVPHTAQSEARERFASYTQSVAFQISLSRRMIDVLRETRDHGFPWIPLGRDVTPEEERLYHERHKVFDSEIILGDKLYRKHDFVTVFRSLERRGLLTMNTSTKKKGEKWLELTLAGEIMCELLVEAGLLAPCVAVKTSKR